MAAIVLAGCLQLIHMACEHSGLLGHFVPERCGRVIYGLKRVCEIIARSMLDPVAFVFIQLVRAPFVCINCLCIFRRRYRAEEEQPFTGPRAV